MRCMSNLVAALILLAIVIGIAVAVGMIASGIVQRSSPQGGDAVIAGAVVFYDSATHRVRAELEVQVVGATPLEITGVRVNGVSLSIRSPPPGSYFEPNTIVKVVAEGTASVSGDKVRVIVEYCDANGKCSSTSSIAKVMLV